MCENSVADSVSLSLSAPSAKVFSREARTKALSDKNLSRDVKNEEPLSANSEASSASLKRGTLRSRAKLGFKDKAKTVSLPYEATLLGEAILPLPIAKKKLFKAKPRVSQPKQANI